MSHPDDDLSLSSDDGDGGMSEGPPVLEDMVPHMAAGDQPGDGGMPQWAIDLGLVPGFGGGLQVDFPSYHGIVSC
jgi:hypothetical protein